MKKIAIVGSRGFRALWRVESLVDHIAVDYAFWKDEVEIVSGGAEGVDTEANLVALSNQLKTKIFLPDYKKYADRPKFAPIARNYEIVDYADEIHAFWDGKSAGTRSVIDYAKEQGKPIRVYYDD